MRLMKREELKELLEEKNGPCVSIYMPTLTGRIDTKQNPIRYRKMLREAELGLAEWGMKPAEAKDYLEPARRLLDDTKFWQTQKGGLAVFLSGRIKRVYSLPLDFSEMVRVGDRFCVRQALPLFAEDGRFFVLALSRRSANLYECSRYSVAETELPRTPSTIYDLLDLDPRKKQLQFHSQSSGRAARVRAAMFHGHAEDTDEDKENILVYFHSVDKVVASTLKNSGAPLVLAGVDYLTRIYEKANSYPLLAKGRVTGNPAELSLEELRDRAWDVVRPGIEAGSRAALKQFEELRGTPRASNHLRTILQAAGEGRVDTLLVCSKGQRWGIFDEATGVMDMHATQAPCDMELLDLCAARTLDHGGQVYALEERKMPWRAPAAAIFRY